MAQEVRDSSTNENDLIVMAVKVIGKGQRREVFKQIYFGKRRSKTAAEIAEATGLTQKRVTEHGKALSRRHIVTQINDRGISYEKVDAFVALKDKILKLTDDPAALEKLPTKVRPKVDVKLPKFVRLSTKHARVQRITIDEIDNFALVKALAPGENLPEAMSEEQFKLGVQNILGQRGEFKDWGGEYADLSSSYLRMNGVRQYAAFAFKGPGAKGKLTPGKMGKNGDQIQRLFQLDAGVFFVQYYREIEQSVLIEMRAHAVSKSLQTGDIIKYGIITGQDSERLRLAYARKFPEKKGK